MMLCFLFGNCIEIFCVGSSSLGIVNVEDKTVSVTLVSGWETAE